MSKVVQIIETLEKNIQKLLSKKVVLEETNENLRLMVSQNLQTIQTQKEEIALLKQELEALKIANSLLGSDDFKKETKLKINSLVREIDYCIAQLSD